MKIKWTDDERLLPDVGKVQKNKVYDVPNDIGKAVIKQKQAKAVKVKKRGDK